MSSAAQTEETVANPQAEVKIDPQAAKIAIVLDALGREGPLTSGESAMAAELGSVPAVAAARKAHKARLQAAAWRDEQERIAGLQAAEAAREAEKQAEIQTRRKAWRDADPLVRALHLVAKEIKPDRLGKVLLRLAGLIENPAGTLRKPGGMHPWGESYPASDRPPPATFQPLPLGWDPEDGE